MGFLWDTNADVTSRRETAQSPQTPSVPSKSQLEEWRKRKESHEQVAVGEKVVRPTKELREQVGKDGGHAEGKK
jgi:hypothetical protein